VGDCDIPGGGFGARISVLRTNGKERLKAN
jgi:hypothetical protein